LFSYEVAKVISYILRPWFKRLCASSLKRTTYRSAYCLSITFLSCNCLIINDFAWM